MKRLWKKYRSISAKTKKRFAATMVFIAVVFANLSPVFAQLGASSPIISSPSSSSIIHFGTDVESNLISGGECQNGYLGGLVGTGIVEPLSLMVTGTTGYDLGCAKDDLLSKGDPSKILSIVDSASGGLVGGVGNAVALLLEQRPASGIDYIEQQVYALTNPGQVSAQEPPAYYRGTGFDLLRPMQSFWGWSVNIVYALMILIVIFVAFGIIFRTSLNGGVVVALQSAIPNIVLAMILVPLSYAITGLFVDGITVGVNVVHQFLIGNGSPGNEIYQNRNEEFPIDNLLSVRLGNSTDPERDFDRGLYADDIRLSWVYVSANLGYTERLRPAIINIASYFPIGDAIESVANSFIGDALLVVVNLVIGFILLWTGARILWLLLGKFVAFLVGPLFAPFIFATVALPSGGTKMIFSYLKTVGAASLYYIVAYAMFLLAMVIASDYILVQVAAVGTPNFMPPLLGLEIFDPNASGGGQVVPGGLISLYLTAASLVIYMLIPSTLKKIDAMLGVNDGGIMAIFNDVKKSVSDSVGMAKAWRDRSIQASRLPGKGMTLAQKRLFGINPEDYRSWQNIVGRNATRAMSALDKTGERAKSIPILGKAISAATGSLATAVGAGANAVAGENVASSKLEDLKVVFSWGQAENVVSIDELFLLNNLKLLMSKNAVSGAALVISTEKGKLPTPLDTANVSVVNAVSTGRLSSDEEYSRKNAVTGSNTPRSAKGAPLTKAAVDIITGRPLRDTLLPKMAGLNKMLRFKNNYRIITMISKTLSNPKDKFEVGSFYLVLDGDKIVTDDGQKKAKVPLKFQLKADEIVGVIEKGYFKSELAGLPGYPPKTTKAGVLVDADITRAEITYRMFFQAMYFMVIKAGNNPVFRINRGESNPVDVSFVFTKLPAEFKDPIWDRKINF